MRPHSETPGTRSPDGPSDCPPRCRSHRQVALVRRSGWVGLPGEQKFVLRCLYACADHAVCPVSLVDFYLWGRTSFGSPVGIRPSKQRFGGDRTPPTPSPDRVSQGLPLRTGFLRDFRVCAQQPAKQEAGARERTGQGEEGCSYFRESPVGHTRPNGWKSTGWRLFGRCVSAPLVCGWSLDAAADIQPEV